jgi:hypothetical protein
VAIVASSRDAVESAQLACLDLGAAVSTGEIARVEVFTQRCGYESLL